MSSELYAPSEASPTEPATILMRQIEGWCPERATCTMFCQSRDRALGILAEVIGPLALGDGTAWCRPMRG
jgi:hypothetical protein